MLTLVQPQPPAATDPEPVEAAQANGEKREKKKEDEPAEADKPVETVQTNGDKEPESDKPADELAKSDDVQDVSIATDSGASDMARKTHLAIGRRGRRECIR